MILEEIEQKFPVGSQVVQGRFTGIVVAHIVYETKHCHLKIDWLPVERVMARLTGKELSEAQPNRLQHPNNVRLKEVPCEQE